MVMYGCIRSCIVMVMNCSVGCMVKNGLVWSFKVQCEEIGNKVIWGMKVVSEK